MNNRVNVFMKIYITLQWFKFEYLFTIAYFGCYISNYNICYIQRLGTNSMN